MKTFLMTAMILSAFSFSQAKGLSKGHFKKMIQELNLNTEQMHKMKAFRKEHKAKRKDIKPQMKALREKMKTAFISNASDSELRSIHSEILALRKTKADFKINKMIALKGILTQEQRRKLIELRKRK